MYNIGIVGSGFGVYGLLPAFASIPDCTVVSLCGKQTLRTQAACSQYDVQRIYADWKTMLEKERIDILATAVVPHAQYVIAQYAIQNGIHIFAEKPLARTHAEAQQLLEAATKKHVVHAIDFLFPEIPTWQMVKKMLVQKKFGALRHISVRWNFLGHDIGNQTVSWKTDVKQGGGALSFYFSHVLYNLMYFMGAIAGVHDVYLRTSPGAHGEQFETGVDALFRFTSGATGEAHMSCDSRDSYIHELIFSCENGSIGLSNTRPFVGGFSIQCIDRSHRETYIQEPDKLSDAKEDARVPLVASIANRFIDAIRQGNRMTPSFADGVAVARVMEDMRAVALHP